MVQPTLLTSIRITVSCISIQPPLCCSMPALCLQVSIWLAAFRVSPFLRLQTVLKVLQAVAAFIRQAIFQVQTICKVPIKLCTVNILLVLVLALLVQIIALTTCAHQVYMSVDRHSQGSWRARQQRGLNCYTQYEINDGCMLASKACASTMVVLGI